MEKEDDVRRAFGLALRALRRRAGYSQEQLALAGISRGHISEMERGQRDPRLSMLVHLSRLLKVPLSVLVVEIERNYLRLTGGGSDGMTEDVLHIVDAEPENGICW